jgi:methionyl-tRNA formyltransferase
MRIIFAGTPAFSVAALDALVAAGHVVVLVLTQPDRPSGRGLRTAPSAVKAAAERHGIPVLQPLTLKDSGTQARLRDARADALVVAAYGLILPQAVLDLPRHGAINIHASLLPRWRGAAPIQRALLAGDPVSGISIMQMDAGLDTGPVLLREAVDIAPDETGGTLHDKLASLGARLIVTALERISRGVAQATPQPAAGATYAPKIGKTEARIDWTRAAVEIERQIRAFNPFPGALARLRADDIKVWRSTQVSAAPAAPGVGSPGAILRVDDAGIEVACGVGALRLTELQRAGGKRLSADAFLRGCAIAPGESFEAVAPIESSPPHPI